VRDEGFNPPFKFGAGQQDTVLTGAADNADIRPQPHYFPLVAAAGVWFL